MYRVETSETTWKKITRFETWDEDENFFIFYWDDGEELMLKKDLIMYIQKYQN